MAYPKPVRQPHLQYLLDHLEHAATSFIPVAISVILLALTYGAGFMAGNNNGYNSAKTNLAFCGELICPLMPLGPVQ